ncbi:MAG: hypothetical protein N2Z85_02115 [Patescibacteria group bacterium]|nr:hypothetical protein [Patescibacteria group bacterium]
MKKIITKLFPWVIFLFLIFFSFYVSWNLRFYLRFGNEVGHWYLGHLILKGKKLYQDLFSHHQPFIYYFSALIEYIFKPENLYKYVGFQRLSIFFYSFLWSFLYFIFFGKISLVFIFVFEFIKLFFLGYQNLGETFAVYPFVFLLGNIFKEHIYKKSSTLETILYSIANFLVFFSLLPLWPAVSLLFIFKFIITKNRYKKILIISTVLLFLLNGFFISYPDYFKSTIFYNLKYYISSYNKDNNLINILLFPFQSIIPPYDQISILTLPFVFSFLYILVYSFKKERKFFYFFIFLIFILYLSNTRDPIIKFGDFPKFHLLPWLGFFYFLIIISLNYLFKKNRKILFLIIFIIIINASFSIFKNKNFYQKRDFLNDFYINYSESEKYGRIINVLKDKNDKLLVLPNDPLIYYLTNIFPPIKITEYYVWMDKIPEEKERLKKLFEKNQPEFIINTGLKNDHYSEKITNYYLEKNYINIKHLNEKSKLFIHKNKINKITKDNIKKAEELLFKIEN